MYGCAEHDPSIFKAQFKWILCFFVCEVISDSSITMLPWVLPRCQSVYSAAQFSAAVVLEILTLLSACSSALMLPKVLATVDRRQMSATMQFSAKKCKIQLQSRIHSSGSLRQTSATHSKKYLELSFEMNLYTSLCHSGTSFSVSEVALTSLAILQGALLQSQYFL